MSVLIHGKNYITVAERVLEAHNADNLSITTELLPVEGYIVVKATVVTDKGTFTGISAANPDKPIEKMSPFEVAETSAVGRALGFAGFGMVDSIASADEMVKAEVSDAFDQSSSEVPDVTPVSLGVCKKCGSPMAVSKRTGAPYCSKMCWKEING